MGSKHSNHGAISPAPIFLLLRKCHTGFHTGWTGSCLSAMYKWSFLHSIFDLLFHLLYIFYRYLFYAYECFDCMYVCTPCVCPVPEDLRKDLLKLELWMVWATTWVLEIEAWSVARTNVRNRWTIALASSSMPVLCFQAGLEFIMWLKIDWTSGSFVSTSQILRLKIWTNILAYMMLRTELSSLCILGKRSTNELHP